ncbi:MAG: ATP-dependent RNA helicase HrpA [Opitutaceae bacterium]|nr:ATP-dependent RNA helicase HrpA [Opitutaceae bacterium]
MPAPEKPFPFRLEFPPELPISARAEEITATIQASQVVILAGETGSGKTTQIPKMCLAAGCGTRGRIACTQPRRVAALSVSRRVAEELGVQWGREVGCKIRFNDETTRDTVIKFLTDGMLLAEVQGDPLLRDYDTIIIDEAHERSLNIDFLLGHLRTLRFKRPELKIVITSATIDTAAFSEAFDGAPVVLVEGRTFPVEVIYAPLDSLGSDAAEGDEREARAEALHYIDGAVEAVERIVRESDAGDVLVFLPSERDIRELGDLLEGRRLRGCEVIPMFGRLTNAEQQRVFAPTQRRKLVLATNIAETSLTIPGIRFVVDTGLARLSRYSPQARTRRLPIEPVSQSSADQRKGRSGRVADGVCIRLYSEKDFLERPRFTQPEIQRANLADVILRMKAFGLGDIERFPFINMPAAKSIRAGYQLLEELGALEPPSGRKEQGEGRREETHVLASVPSPFSHPPSPASAELTPLGRELARLPVDPTVGRMILQARSEKALREVAIIAAGLSIQDPRERPMDKQQQADAAHRRFVHPDSDFLTLLNIWEAFHDEFENLTQAKLRRFCRDHFLSYTRLREWRDIHTQLIDTLEQRDDFKLTSAYHGLKEVDEKTTVFGTPSYRAIHRSILAGLLGNIAHLDEENGGYKATHDRRVALFPGSALFRREEPRKRGDNGPQRDAPKNGAKSPRWILSAEIMETTRLYARTCARLDPLWALDLGAHVARVAHSEPFWNEEQGRVLVKQRTRLYGLELESRAVSYGKIDPAHATEIFIREALVNDTVRYPLDCLAHNRAAREKIEDLLTRARDSSYLNLDEAAYRFYAARLRNVGGVPSPRSGEASAIPRGGGTPPTTEGISSVAELVDLVRERRGAEPRFLFMEPADLRDPETIAVDAAAFPAALPLVNSALPLNYAYKPGQADDGVTLDVSVREAEALTPAALDWAVPGHLEGKVEHYLRALPKELRRGFVPLGETAKSLATQLASRDRLTARRESLPAALAAQIAERFRVAIDPAVWADKPPPDHWRVRVRVVDPDGKEIVASRELAEIRAALLAQSREASKAIAREEPAAWRAIRAKWETPEHTNWAWDEVPERVLVSDQGGAPAYAFTGLLAGRDGVARRLFRTPEEATAATRRGLAALFERQLGHDLMWTQRDLRALRELGPLAATLAPIDALQEQAFESIRRWVLERPVAPLAAAAFSTVLGRAKTDLRGIVPRLVDLLRETFNLRLELQVLPAAPAWVAADLAALVPADFLRVTPYARLAHVPRYLKAMKVRAERARKNPAKDAERVAQLAPYAAAAAKLRATEGGEALRWLVEEFRVSLFAQELGTAEPVSAVKLDRVVEALRGPATPVAPTARPLVATTAGGPKKGAPLKSLGALDKLIGR